MILLVNDRIVCVKIMWFRWLGADFDNHNEFIVILIGLNYSGSMVSVAARFRDLWEVVNQKPSIDIIIIKG